MSDTTEAAEVVADKTMELAQALSQELKKERKGSGKRMSFASAVIVLLCSAVGFGGYDLVTDGIDSESFVKLADAVEQNTETSRNTLNAVAILSDVFADHEDEAMQKFDDFMDQLDYINLESDVRQNTFRLELSIEKAEDEIELFALRTVQRRSEDTLTPELQEIYQMSIKNLNDDIDQYRAQIVKEEKRLADWVRGFRGND